jgi:hypothetical protein
MRGSWVSKNAEQNAPKNSYFNMTVIFDEKSQNFTVLLHFLAEAVFEAVKNV